MVKRQGNKAQAEEVQPEDIDFVDEPEIEQDGNQLTENVVNPLAKHETSPNGNFGIYWWALNQQRAKRIDENGKIVYNPKTGKPFYDDNEKLPYQFVIGQGSNVLVTLEVKYLVKFYKELKRFKGDINAINKISRLRSAEDTDEIE